MTPLKGEHYSLPFLPATPSSLSQTLDSPRALLPEIQRYKDTISQVCRARRKGPGTPSKTSDANLDCAFVENALFYTDH